MKQPLQYAKTKEGHWIFIEEAIPGNSYICPLCEKELRVRKTKFGQSFYHAPEKKENLWGGEGELHKAVKEKIKSWGQNHHYLVEEEWIVEERRGDLYFPPQWIVEVQCSPLSARMLEKRHLDYQRQGYKDLWLLGPKYQRYSQWYPFLRYHPTYGYYVLRFDERQFYLQSHLEEAPYRFTCVPITIEEFLHKEKGKIMPPNRQFFQEQNKKRISAWFHRSNKEVQRLAYILYEYQMNWQEELSYLSQWINVPFYSLTEELYWKVEQKICQPLMTYTPTPFLEEKRKQQKLKKSKE